jgi:nucleoside-diphosphate-sugar epimerase
MPQILITGGTGFLGANTARAFAANGIPVVVTSRKRHDPVGEELAAESDLITVERLDFSRAGEVYDLFSRYRFEGIVMLVHAHQYARSRTANNAIYDITLNCLEGATASGVKRCVLASSIVVYAGMIPPFTEDVPFPVEISYEGKRGLIRPPKFETVVKRTIELIAIDYGTPMDRATSGTAGTDHPHHLEVVALRYPIQWGSGYSAMGNHYSLAAHAAAGRIDSLKDRVGYYNLPIGPLWNGPRPPGMFIKDSADAIVTVMQAETLPHNIYNVSSGFTTSPRKQLEALYKVAPESRESIGIAPEDLRESRPDLGFNADLLKADFGWSSAYTIESAFEEYIAWLQDHPY